MKNYYNNDYIKFSEKKYGTIKGMSIIQNTLFVFYQNEFLNIFDLESHKCLYDKKINRNAVNCTNINRELVKITWEKTCIHVHIKNKFYVVSILNNKKRLNKIVNENMILKAGYDSVFLLQDSKGRTVIKGKHNNWVSDGIIIKDYLITVSYDGVVKKWDIRKRKCIGSLSIKEGWITAVQNKNDTIYIGTQYGKVYEIKSEKINQQRGSIGSVWNIYEYRKKIYTVSEDGKIVRYDEQLNWKNERQCSYGWINAMNIKDENLLLVTSLGEIIQVSKTLNESRILTETKMWINSIVTIDNEVWFVTAEGKIGYSNNMLSTIKYFKISQYQLIDIAYYSELNQLVAIDVEGNVYFIDRTARIIQQLLFKMCHFTSICINRLMKLIYISTLEGIVICLSILDFSYKIKKLSKGRIWKIAWHEQTNQVVAITTEKKVMLLDYELETVLEEKKENSFLTTCGVSENWIFAGDDKGKIFKYQIKRNELSINRNKDIKLEDLHINNTLQNENKVVIYINSSDINTAIYQERDEILMELCGYSYELIDISNNQHLKSTVIANSGWNKFPQILVNNHFISSASVLPHMFETGTLKILFDNLLLSKD